MWFILFNRVWKLYLKRKRQFSLFCDSLPVCKKSYFWDRKLPGGVFWRHLPKESTWYLLRRDRGEVTTSGQTDRQSHFIVLDVSYDSIALKWGTAWRYGITMYNYSDFNLIVTPQNRGHNKVRQSKFLILFCRPRLRIWLPFHDQWSEYQK